VCLCIDYFTRIGAGEQTRVFDELPPESADSTSPNGVGENVVEMARGDYAKAMPPNAPRITTRSGGARHEASNTNPIKARAKSPGDPTELTHNTL
jgi:hypothetical protein